MSSRPWCCPDHRCEVVFQAAQSNLAECQPGESFFCWGKMEAAVAFTYNGVDHENDLSLCACTPLKGIIRFQVNRADLEWITTGCRRTTEKLDGVRQVSHQERALKDIRDVLQNTEGCSDFLDVIAKVEECVERGLGED